MRSHKTTVGLERGKRSPKGRKTQRERRGTDGAGKDIKVRKGKNNNRMDGRDIKGRERKNNNWMEGMGCYYGVNFKYNR